MVAVVCAYRKKRMRVVARRSPRKPLAVALSVEIGYERKYARIVRVDFKKREYENLRRRLQNDVYLFNDIPLILEKQQTISGYAYNSIFGQGNSFESLFELSFDQSLRRDNKNAYITRYYLNTSNDRNLTAGMLSFRCSI